MQRDRHLRWSFAACKCLSAIITNNPHTPTVLDGLTDAKNIYQPTTSSQPLDHSKY